MLDDAPELRVQRHVAVAQRARPHHLLAPEQRREEGDHECVDVEQRQCGENDRLFVQHGVGRDHPGVADLVGVRVRGESGRARRAAGVEEGGEVGGGGGRAEEVVAWAVCGQLGEVGHIGDGLGGVRLGARGAQDKDVVDQAVADQPGPGLEGRAVQFGRRGDQDPGTGAAEEFGDMVVGERRVDGGDDPGELCAQQRGDELVAVRGEQCDAVAPADPEPVQGVGDLMHICEEVRVRPGAR